MAEEKKEDKKEEKKEEAKEGAEGAAEGSEGADAEAAKKKKKNKLIIIAASVLVLLLGVGGGTFFVLKGKKAESENAAHEEGGHGEKSEGGGHGAGGAAGPVGPVFLDLKEFLVNLNSSGKQTNFLKMTVTLELADEKSKAAVDANMPRIVDAFQVYLRELRSDDLKGSSGIQLLREELLLRINKIIYPEKANDILFKEIIVQ